MNFREYRNPAIAFVASNRHLSASASPRASVRKPFDPVLGSVAVGSMTLILASVITGMDFLAVLALLIALVYIRLAGSLKSSTALSAADVERWQAGAAPSRTFTAKRSQRRSAYDGLAS